MVRRAKRVCRCTKCPAHTGSCPIIVASGLCQRCGQQAEQARGSRQERGYDSGHDRLRRQWKPKVDAGQVLCHAKVCVMPARFITPGTAWDLGHTEDRTQWTGPEHARCNRVAGGKAAHGG